MNSRRVNALEHVVVPRIQSYISFIKKVLDEQAREDFFRMKKLTDKKKKLKEKTRREKDLKGEGKAAEKDDDIGTESAAPGGDEKSAVAAFGADEGDEDLIF